MEYENNGAAAGCMWSLIFQKSNLTASDSQFFGLKKKSEIDLNGLLITLGPHGTSCYSVLSFKNILNSNLKADYFLFESHLILLDSDKSHWTSSLGV